MLDPDPPVEVLLFRESATSPDWDRMDTAEGPSLLFTL